MNEWVMVDFQHPADDDHSLPRVELKTVEELRHYLEQRSIQSPAVLEFRKSRDEAMIIAIGGPFAGLRWARTPATLFFQIAVATIITSGHLVEFANQGQHLRLPPKELFPVEEIIDAVVYYYSSGKLPGWITWKKWNHLSSQWEIIAGNPLSRHQASQSDENDETDEKSTPY